MRPFSFVRGLVLIVSSLASQFAGAASFSVIGGLPVGIQSIEQASGLSSDGSTVVGTAIADDRTRRAFLWNAGDGFRLIEGLPLGTTSSRALDVSADGTRVLGGTNEGIFLWDESTGARIVEPLPSAPAAILLSGLSDDGSTFVGTRGEDQSFSEREALIWNERDGLRGLSQLPGGPAMATATGVSADGSRVLIIADDGLGGAEAAIWDDVNGVRGLGDLDGGSFASSPLAISNDGSTVVGFGSIEPSASGVDTGRRAMIWNEADGMRALGSLFGGLYDSVALGVSGDGSVVVGTDNDNARFGLPSSKAFIWDEANGMRALDVLLTSLGIDLTGWELLEATAVSADGLTVLGRASDPSGGIQHFIAVIPEPGTGLLLGLGIALLASRAERRVGRWA